MPRSDGTDPTAATRQARRRARAQAQGQRDQATLGAVLAAVLELSRKVDNLAASVDNRDVTRPGVTSRGQGARSRAGGTRPQAPTGPVGPVTVTPSRPDGELGGAVLAALQGNGANSAGAIRDYLGHGGLEVPVGQVATALVQLQGQALVIREPGARPQEPDRWRAVPGALAALELDAHLLEVRPAPEVHVTCNAYQDHQADHRWDAALGTFVCARCHPTPTTAQAQAAMAVAS